MKLPFTISRINRIVLIAILALALIWAILRFFILHYDPVRPFVIACAEPYLLLTEKLSNFFLSFTTPGVIIGHHKIFFNDKETGSFDSGVLFKKLTFFLLVLIWIIRAPVKKKILFTCILFVTNFVFVAIDNAILAHIIVKGFEEETWPKISRTPGLLALATIFTIWILNNRASVIDSLGKFRLNTELINGKITEMIILLFFYIVVNNFIYGSLDLHIWRNLMISSVHKILTVLGYDSVIDGYYIVGNNGTVFIDRGCVGYNSILKFGVIVFLTGVSNIRRWSYIISGALFLLLLSGIRLFMIFIWYEKYSYVRAMHFHDFSKHSIFVIIFILWIIWFEFFTDIRPKQGKRKGKIYPVFT